MALYERIGNLHIHTTYSDGSGDYEQLAQAASKVGLDYLLVTDHNIYAGQHQGWNKDTLVLVGEEVANETDDQVNHYLVFGANKGMASHGNDPQQLIDAVRSHGGLGFIAHPYERSGRFADEPEIDWVNWEVEGYNGLEIWNYMSEFKSHIENPAKALLYAFAPSLAIKGPFPETLAKWDELLARQKICAIGGSDAHATTYQMGPIKRQIFSYKYLFKTINTHILVSEPWSGKAAHDAQLV